MYNTQHEIRCPTVSIRLSSYYTRFNGLFTLLETDFNTNSDLDSEPNGYAHELTQNSANRADPCVGGKFPGCVFGYTVLYRNCFHRMHSDSDSNLDPYGYCIHFWDKTWIGVKLPIAQNFDSDRDPIPSSFL